MSVNMSVPDIPTRPRVGRPTLFFAGLYSSRPPKGDGCDGRKLMDQLLSLKDIQSRLSISRSTAYRFIRAHHIPVIYVLGSPRVRAADIDRALTSSEVI